MGGFSIPPETISFSCPYGDKPCPKMMEQEEEIKELRTDLKTMQRYLYMIMGMVAVNWGFTLW